MGGSYFRPEKSLPTSLPLWVDSEVMQCDYIILGEGNRTIKIKISPAVFNLTPNTEVIEGLAIRRMPLFWGEPKLGPLLSS
tara:strand:+ start:247 stop:489 length:243 start_codon:yes stop_codon:yes gene_type:complete